MHLFPTDILHTLEFDKVLQSIAAYCETTHGLERVNNIKPQSKHEEIVKLLSQANEMKQMLMFEDKLQRNARLIQEQLFRFCKLKICVERNTSASTQKKCNSIRKPDKISAQQHRKISGAEYNGSANCI